MMIPFENLENASKEELIETYKEAKEKKQLASQMLDTIRKTEMDYFVYKKTQEYIEKIEEIFRFRNYDIKELEK